MRGVLAVYLLVVSGAAVVAPSLFWVMLAGAGAVALAVLGFRHLVGISAAWLLVVGCTLEMSLGDLISPAAYQPIVGMVKGVGLGLAALAVVRFGPSPDLFNPGLAFVAMFVIGWAHGLHADLTLGESLRSLVGSAAPYAFSFSRLSIGWSRAIIRMTMWTPLISVAIGAVLAVGGVRPLFVESGGARLAALGHPAFLAGFALAAIYACLIELYRDGRRGRLVLMGANAVILVLTGARAPLLYGRCVLALTFGFVPSAVLSRRRRFTLLLGAVACLPVMLGLAESYATLRLFNAAMHETVNLSGRGELWPLFERAAAESPWFGWGVGAGNVIVSPTSELFRDMQTLAAHNEYLRMEVEGGQIGRALLILWFVMWCVCHSRGLPRTERVIMRLVFVAFACHAFTDNVLISSSASVLFTFVSAVFARGWLEQAARITEVSHGSFSRSAGADRLAGATAGGGGWAGVRDEFRQRVDKPDRHDDAEGAEAYPDPA
jgi:O-antigen ligase